MGPAVKLFIAGLQWQCRCNVAGGVYKGHCACATQREPCRGAAALGDHAETEIYF